MIGLSIGVGLISAITAMVTAYVLYRAFKIQKDILELHLRDSRKNTLYNMLNSNKERILKSIDGTFKGYAITNPEDFLPLTAISLIAEKDIDCQIIFHAEFPGYVHKLFITTSYENKHELQVYHPEILIAYNLPQEVKDWYLGQYVEL